MKRILVTGASGFIGRHCLPPLAAAGHEVHAVSRREPPGSPPGVRWHRADLLDPVQTGELIERVRPTHLLHLAWFVEHGRYRTAPENFRWVAGSIRLVEEFARRGGRRVVAAGTCAEYDRRYGYCSESVTPLRPATPYGVCKHALRLMLESLAGVTGLSAAWGRVFFLFGPGERAERLVPSVVRSLLRGEQAACSHGNQVRDFLYVKDVAQAFVALLDSDVAGPVNIASGRPLAIRDLVGAIAARLDGHRLIRLGCLPVRDDDPPLLVADVRRLRDEVGWTPKYGLARGLDETIHWWKRRMGERSEHAADY